MQFFNKNKFSVSKLTDQLQVAPGVAFSLPLYIVDFLVGAQPTSVTATMVKISGRTKVTLTDVVTMSKTKDNYYTASATPTVLQWDGLTTLNLVVNIDSSIVSIPLFTAA